jgi:biopolymer transport protein ExbD
VNPLVPIQIRKRPGRLPLTPLIDCVFILLVFFMLQTNFLRPTAIEFSKASGTSVSISELTTLSVELHVNGSIWLNGEKSDMKGLRKLASSIATPNKTRVILAVDSSVKLQRAVDVMDIFNQYDIVNIAMSAARKFD